jgi:uncharacterized membrane protein
VTIDGIQLDDEESLPPHVEETVLAIQKLHVEHHSRTTPLEHSAARATSFIARPAFLGVLTLAVAFWIVANLLLRRTSLAFDAPPFPWLETVLQLGAIYIAALILITQKRADALAARREQLTLQLAILSEQKAAKIISLIEELRRDSPQIANRRDREVDAMASPVDHKAVTKVLEEVVPDDGAPTPKAGRSTKSDNESYVFHDII